MTPAVYLIEYSYYLDGQTTVSLLTADELTAWLRKNVESHHYASDGYDVNRLFRYQDGTLTPLDVRPEPGRPDLDGDGYLRYGYEIRRADGGHAAAGPEIAFTVTIDGRA